ncbi:uncharacterized protein B0I36DRAFT_232726 [Microdochium trichocladiopsis]|uniref:Stealth protein CR3 conserved region 3 domain-containing protein n=1 Tax=Microdochium trichocladiopsis TaxID=1682393 RepID=A0A9P8YJZ0_9PEZI|nr:uncharacterized protein B0I36DRAFT_232726 [Microdochium trichocladiopsis]KAH7041408.1 hypothetical protein B0I36DRAFT_232726 [Microdochium trichocladiopsis]
MYAHAFAPSPRSRSPIISRSWLRRRRAVAVSTVIILLLWQTLHSSKDRGKYPQWKDSYAPEGPHEQSRPPLPQQRILVDIELSRPQGKYGRPWRAPAKHKELLDDDDEHDNGGLHDAQTGSWNPDGSLYEFPPYQAWLDLDAKADTLPDILHIPLEESVQEETLEGWEDEWFSQATYDREVWGTMQEPRVDFIYTWVNGSQEAFVRTMRPYELNSTLNDADGEWLLSHGSNRYRSWDELRYSVRSVEKYAASFTNKIQIVVNAVDESRDPGVRRYTKQRPLWLSEAAETAGLVEVLSQEEFFGEEERAALPSFNSLTIESQLYNTPSDIDRFFALSDDMLLGRTHAASDVYSPLFGPILGFKPNGYNTMTPPDEVDARRFGEKPYLIYTSWMLNRRFGLRKRDGQAHFGHSMSRSISREVRDSFPRPSLRSACQRFRGETGFQLYTWYAAFHYTVERHREALLYSYVVLRSDTDGNGNLGWHERAQMMRELEEGMQHEDDEGFRDKIYRNVAEHLNAAGLEPPRANVDLQWTSLDGPMAIRDIDCLEFDVNECLAPAFSREAADARHPSPVFNTASVFDRVARQDPICGDCLLKLLLNRQPAGLEPLLPPHETMQGHREMILKALKRYQYSVIDPDGLFFMITDAEQVQSELTDQLLGGGGGGKRREVGQLCFNDDVVTNDEFELQALKQAMKNLFQGLLPEPSRFESDVL